MSVAFLTAAFAARIGKSTTKSVLVAIADRADDKTGFCFPSVADIVQRTELDRKTVLACMKSLEESGFIVDTKKRVGATNQIKIWKLDINKIHEASQKRDGSDKASQKRNRSVFPQEESRFSARRVPVLGHETVSEPSLNHHHAEKEVEIDGLVEAAIWTYRKYGHVVKNESAFKSKIFSRISTHGANQEDLGNFANWQKHFQKEPLKILEKNSSDASKTQLEVGERMLARIRKVAV